MLKGIPVPSHSHWHPNYFHPSPPTKYFPVQGSSFCVSHATRPGMLIPVPIDDRPRATLHRYHGHCPDVGSVLVYRMDSLSPGLPEQVGKMAEATYQKAVTGVTFGYGDHQCSGMSYRPRVMLQVKDSNPPPTLTKFPGQTLPVLPASCS